MNNIEWLHSNCLIFIVCYFTVDNLLCCVAHEYERLFDEYAYTYEEAVTPSGATPTYETS